MPKDRAAKIAIAVEFAALIRSLAEYFRLKHFSGHPLTLAIAEPYITGALIAAVFTAVSVGLFFLGWYRAVIGVAGCCVLLLIIYKIVVLGWGVW